MPDVFISYSRTDIAFARLIHEALEDANVDTWIDWARIPVGVKWWENICEAIQDCTVFLFIISRQSVGSRICKDEVSCALDNNKRIVPIVLDNLDAAVIGDFVPDLSKINWILIQKGTHFVVEELDVVTVSDDQSAATPVMPAFGEVVKKLTEAIRTDWNLVEAHKVILLKAKVWGDSHRHPDFLIRGEEFRKLHEIFLHPAEGCPQPTDLMLSFLEASKKEWERHLSGLHQWYVIRTENIKYAPDFEIECVKCGGSYTFTPSEHKPMPEFCPHCSFGSR